MLSDAHWANLRRHLLARQDLAPSTVHKTLKSLRALELAGISLETPDVEELDEYVATRKERGARGAGLQHYAKAYRRLLRWHNLNHVHVRVPRADEVEIRVPRDGEVLRLLEYGRGTCREHHVQVELARFAFRLLHGTPMRPPSEVVEAQLADFNARAGTLRFYCFKTRRWRLVRLDPWIVSEISAYTRGLRARLDKHNAPTLLVDARGLPWRRDTFRLWLGRHARRAGLDDWHPYLARHHSIMWRLRRNGYRILPVARWAGDTIKTIERYVHLDADELWEPTPGLLEHEAAREDRAIDRADLHRADRAHDHVDDQDDGAAR